MMKTIILKGLLTVSMAFPAVTHAQTVLPYMDSNGPTPREIQCRIADHGMVYHDGPCFFQSSGDGAFTIVTGDQKYAAAVGPIDGDQAQGLWTEEAFASHMHGQIHTLKRSRADRACWENDELSICAW